MPRSDGRPDDCLSDLRMDCLLADALPAREAQEVREHLAGCEACSRRFASIRAGFDAWDPSALPRAMVAVPTPRRRFVVPALAAAVACAAVALLVVRRPGPSGPDEGTRTKGDAAFALYVQHGADLRPAGALEVVRPGDRIQILYTLERPAYLAVLSRDGAGAVSVYAPDTSRAAWRAEPATAAPLPNSTILDGTLGREEIHALRCLQPIELEPVRAALEADPRGFAPPVGCSEELFVLDKREGP